MRLLYLVFSVMFTAGMAAQWNGDVDKFVFFEDSIQLNDVNTGTAYLSQESDIIEDATWEFTVNIKQGTSSSNYAIVYLVSLDSTLVGPGYYVMIGNTSDEVSLYRQDADGKSEIIDGLDKRIDYKPTLIRVKVTRTASGLWSLYVLDNDTSTFIMEGEAFDNTYVKSAYFGIKAVYTKTRAQETSFSNIMIQGNSYTDLTPPHLLAWDAVSQKQLQLIFDEEIIVNSITLDGKELVSYTQSGDSVFLVYDQAIGTNDSSKVDLHVSDLQGNVLDTLFKVIYTPFSVLSVQMKDSVSLSFQLNKKPVSIPNSSVLLDGLSPESIVGEALTYIAIFSSPIASRSFTPVSIRDILDQQGELLIPFEGEVAYYRAEYQDLVFNEVMCDPSPVVGSLPEVEYLEIYNNTPFEIPLEDWELMIKDVAYQIPAYTLKAFDYLIMGKSDGLKLMDDTINTLVIPSFPTLTNTSMTMYLLSSEAILVDVLTYNKAWHTDEFKEDGGFSLERIDVNNPSDIENWTSSCSTDGGTPGAENCSVSDNPDFINPEVDVAFAKALDTIVIQFSELMSNNEIESIIHYSISEGLEISEIIGSTVYLSSEALIVLADPILPEKVYNLHVSGLKDLSDNELIESDLPIAWCEQPSVGDVVINEIMYEPLSNEAEYVELYNTTTSPFNLSDFVITKDDNEGGWLAGKQVSVTNQLLLPHDFIVLTGNAETLSGQYVIEDTKLIDVPSMPSLTNTGDNVAILLRNGAVIDEVKYSPDWHSPLLNSSKGVALERIDASQMSNNKDNWFSASGLNGFGTPGEKNSHAIEGTVSHEIIKLIPEVFTPDGDGQDDFTTLYIDDEYAGGNIEVVIYNRRRQKVRNLVANSLVGAHSSVVWDGTTDEGSRCNVGPYVMIVQIVMPSGNVITHQLEMVISSK